MLFEIEQVTYRYREVTALDGITLSIPRGGRFALLGANGSGKSTFLRLLDGLYFAESGKVTFAGTPLTEESLRDEKFAFDFRRRVGFVFQNPDVQLFNPTVFDELAFGPLQLRWPRDKIRQEIDRVLEKMNLAHLKHRVPHRLSGGEKKRVALASVLILDPEVLLLDEPTAALDPESQSHIVDFISGCDRTKTIITATHDLDMVEDIADRCIVFKGGKVVCFEATARILGDEALLSSASLIHAHRHKHASGIVHSHPHLHKSHDHPPPVR